MIDMFFYNQEMEVMNRALQEALSAWPEDDIDRDYHDKSNFVNDDDDRNGPELTLNTSRSARNTEHRIDSMATQKRYRQCLEKFQDLQDALYRLKIENDTERAVHKYDHDFCDGQYDDKASIRKKASEEADFSQLHPSLNGPLPVSVSRALRSEIVPLPLSSEHVLKSYENKGASICSLLTCCQCGWLNLSRLFWT